MSGFTVLVVGSGGREHALGWKLSTSPQVSRIILAPGNAGMPEEWEQWPFSAHPSEFSGLARRALSEGVDLAVIGPDNPLAEGIVDVFQDAGVLAFGPSREAAKIESSKAFAKEVMSAAGVPTARYQVVSTLEEAKTFLKNTSWAPAQGVGGWVIKADGLAFGKGVRVCLTLTEALQAAEVLISVSGGCGPGKLVIEERLLGEELSWMAFCDGKRCALLEPARDYKTLQDGGRGPNTGGMGAFSPVQGVPAGFEERIHKEVFIPTLQEMENRGAPFRGLLYAGLMVDWEKNKYWVLEFNSRFGDPETQVLMPRMKDDLLDWCLACAKGDLGERSSSVSFFKNAAVVVVGAAPGYPDRPEKGAPLEILTQTAVPCAAAVPPYFFSGVDKNKGGLTTAGGRVLGATGVGENFELARAQAYERLSQVNFPGMQFRSDIAKGMK